MGCLADRGTDVLLRLSDGQGLANRIFAFREGAIAAESADFPFRDRQMAGEFTDLGRQQPLREIA